MPVRASVAMAAYNGEKYMRQQINSVLKQLSDNDELIISVNPSADLTYEIAEEYADADKRVSVLTCSEHGVQANFDHAIENASGKYIFLCDQDDIWLPDKMETMIRTFERTGAQLIVHDGYITDAGLNYDRCNTLFSQKHPGRGFIRNLFKNSYHGCCIAFCENLKELILPIPRTGFFHDFWIGMICETFRIQVIFLEKQLILYRRHDGNQSGAERTIIPKVLERIRILTALMKRFLYLRFWDRTVLREGNGLGRRPREMKP